MYCRRFMVVALAFAALVAIARAQEPDWRFGFEYIEFDPPFATEAQHDTLLSRLSWVTASQRVPGGINVNGIAGGWNGMQPSAASPISFVQSDSWVRRIQRGGFSLVFNLQMNAPWASAGNSGCIDGLGQDECAADSAHEAAWFNYIKALVERYDGDGVDDMPGLTVPVRFYVMHQEIYYNGQAKGDAGEDRGEGYWDDNVTNLLRAHRIAWQAMRAADPSGKTKLVGSGGWFLDLYGDFPDYPATHGATVRARLAGDNLAHTGYTRGYDSLVKLMEGLADDAGGTACDYIGWHPHSGWKSSDQSMKFIREHAPNKPIFIDDMWSSMLTEVAPFDGYLQFLPAAANERDFPNAAVPTYAALISRLNAGDTVALAVYNAKAARDAVKCFTTIFGEGAERASFSLSNNCNPDNGILYFLSGAWRFTGLVGNKYSNYAMKPVTRTMRLVVDKLHDFTAVARIDVSANPYTRCYRFERRRGTPCYVAWSETVADPVDPSIPNGESVDIPLGTDSAVVTTIMTADTVLSPGVRTVAAPGHVLTRRLGFEPIIIEERDAAGDVAVASGKEAGEVTITSSSGGVMLRFEIFRPTAVRAELFDLAGRRVALFADGRYDTGAHTINAPNGTVRTGAYLVRLRLGRNVTQRLVYIGQ